MFSSNAAHYSPDVISKKPSPTEAQDSTLPKFKLVPIISPHTSSRVSLSGNSLPSHIWFFFLFLFLLIECINKSFPHSHPKPTLFSQFHFKAPYLSPLSCSFLINLPNLSTALTAWIHSCSLAHCWQLWTQQQFEDTQWQNYGRKNNTEENSETDELQGATLCQVLVTWHAVAKNYDLNYWLQTEPGPHSVHASRRYVWQGEQMQSFLYQYTHVQKHFQAYRYGQGLRRGMYLLRQI